MAAQRRGDDQAIGRVAVEVRQLRGPDSDLAVGGDFGQSIPEQLPAPRPEVPQQRRAPLVVQQGDFPERDGRNGRLPRRRVVPPILLRTDARRPAVVSGASDLS